MSRTIRLIAASALAAATVALSGSIGIGQRASHGMNSSSTLMKFPVLLFRACSSRAPTMITIMH